MPQQRNTPQRQIIETILDQTDRPLLPKEILSIANETLPSLGIATVFRALKALVEEGSAHTVNIGDEPARYEGSRGHHHHFKCIRCGDVFDVHGCPGNLEHLLPEGFELSGHEINLFGQCSSCSTNQTA